MEKTERDGKDGKDGAARGGEVDGVGASVEFDRMQKIKSMRGRVSREDYAANLRGFSQPVGEASFVKRHAEQGSKKQGFGLHPPNTASQIHGFVQNSTSARLYLKSKSR